MCLSEVKVTLKAQHKVGRQTVESVCMEGAVGNTKGNEDTTAANVTNMVGCKICIIKSSACRSSELGEADRAYDKLVRVRN